MSVVKNWTTYATVAATILAVVAIAVVIGLISDAETGSMADWVAATATVAALGAAVIAARYAAGAYHLESAREGQLLRAQRSAQAALIAAWPDRFLPHWEHNHDGTSTTIEGITGAVAMLRNASDVPVTNVHVDFTVVLAYAEDELAQANLRYLGGADVAVVPPGPEPLEIRWATEASAVMIPGVPTLGAGDDYPDHGTYDPGRLLVDIVFRDAAGVLWRRDHVGQLDEVLESSLVA